MKKFISLAVTSLMLLLASNTASAVPITGTINFTGNGTVISSSASGIDTMIFESGVVVSAAPLYTNGDFTSVAGGLATFNTFDSSNSNYVLWTAGNFEFTLQNIVSNVYETVFGGNKKVYGTGTIVDTSGILDTVSGQWIMTLNGANANVSFSSTTIPAPAGTALLGLCLLGFAFSRRNKKAK